MRGNITYSKNTILERDDENNVYAYQYEKGYRIGQQRGLIAQGLFRDYDDIRNSPKQSWGAVQPGDIKYKDVNGDGVVNDGDRVAIGATSTPSLIYGLGASISWRGFDFNFHFQGAGKYTFLINGGTVNAFSNGRWGNILKGITDNRWISSDISGTKETENPNAPYPRLSYGSNSNNEQASTFGYATAVSCASKTSTLATQCPNPGSTPYTWRAHESTFRGKTSSRGRPSTFGIPNSTAAGEAKNTPSLVRLRQAYKLVYNHRHTT